MDANKQILKDDISRDCYIRGNGLDGSEQILKDGRIQYRNAWVDTKGMMHRYGTSVAQSYLTPIQFDIPVGDLSHYECVEKRPGVDSYYESQWVYNVEEIA